MKSHSFRNTVRAVSSILVTAAVFICSISPALASVGYCESCGCNKFDKDCFKSDGNNWYCRCGHHYDSHRFSNRPVSFSGSTHAASSKGFFDDTMNIVWTIAAVIAILVMCAEKKAVAPAGVVLFFFIKSVLKYWGVL